MRGGIFLVAFFRIENVVIEQGGVGVKSPIEDLAVGIHDQLGGIAAVAILRIPWSVDAVSIALPGDDSREVAMPIVGINFIEPDPGFEPTLIE